MGVFRANFRGELVGRVELKGFPPELADFKFNSLAEGKGRLFLGDLGNMRIVVTDIEGNFLQLHDIAAMLGEDVAKKRADYGLKSFRVNRNGDILFTIQALFKAYILYADGTLRGFGQRGSAPGKFNVIAGIAQDERGYLYVTDMLKSAVIVFDPEFRFSKEFGYRGRHRGAIVAPVDIVAGDGKVFVSQFGKRGVAVFKIQPPPEEWSGGAPRRAPRCTSAAGAADRTCPLLGRARCAFVCRQPPAGPPRPPTPTSHVRPREPESDMGALGGSGLGHMAQRVWDFHHRGHGPSTMNMAGVQVLARDPLCATSGTCRAEGPRAGRDIPRSSGKQSTAETTERGHR